MKINFEDTTTATIARDFYQFSQPRRFSVLEVPKGFGKTAMTVATCGHYATQLKESGNLGQDEPLDLVIIAPKAVLNQHSWEETVDQYNQTHGNQLRVSETVTSSGFGLFRKNQIALTHPQNIRVEIQQNLMKKARQLAKESDTPLQELYQQVAMDRAKTQNRKAFKTATTLEEMEEILYDVKYRKLQEKTMQAFLKRHERPTILIVDEVQEFKDCKSSRGKALSQAVKSLPKTLSLTAQPAPNNALDYVAYAVYGGFYRSYSQFLSEHITEAMQRNMRLSHASPCYDSDSQGGEAGDFKRDDVIDIDRFWDCINQVIYKPKVTKDFDLPTVTRCITSYSLTTETEEKIKSFLRAKRNREYDSIQACIADIRNAIGSDFNHLRQIPIVFQKMKRHHIQVVQPLIFYQYNSELGDDPSKMDENDPEFKKGILWALKKCGLSYHIINGKNRFRKAMQQDLDKAIVIHYKSGGAGLNFPKSNLTLFYGMTYSWQDMEQAEGRNVRRGQSHNVYQFQILSNNPADLRMQTIISQKKSFTSSTQKAYIRELERWCG